MRKKVEASFTVEAAFIMPVIIAIIVLGLHIAMELQEDVIRQAEKVPAVEMLEPVKEMYMY